MGCIKLDILEKQLSTKKTLTPKNKVKSLRSGYMFGFNGMEKDPEITGQEGSHYTAAFWEYDTRIARRWNVDPVDKPWESSYATFANNPIYWIDPYGDDIDPSKLYEKDENENYKHKNQIIAFETFASTKKGRDFIEDRASAGFELQGIFVKDLHIQIENDGYLHSQGIDYTFDANNENIQAYGYIEHQVTDGRLQFNVHLDTESLDSFRPSQLLGSVETVAHEIFYHGVPYENKFISGNYTLDKNSEINYGRTWMRHYGISDDEYTSYDDQSFHAIPLSQTPWSYQQSVPFLLNAQDIIHSNYRNWFRVHKRVFCPNESMKKWIQLDLKEPLNEQEIREEISNGIWNSGN